MYQLMTKISDGDLRPVSRERDTLLECMQLAGTLYEIFMFNKKDEEFDASKYGIFKRDEEGNWKEVAQVAEGGRP